MRADHVVLSEDLNPTTETRETVSKSPLSQPGADKPSANDSPTSGHVESAPRILGDFEIRREIGRGGMGTVFAAWQQSLQRTVAVKILNQAVSSSSTAVVRFQREAQAAAKLHHPHIVPIFAFGEDDGVYYYAMELVDGPGLNAVIAETRERHLADTASSDLAETLPLSRTPTGAVASNDPAVTRNGTGRSDTTDSAIAAAGLPEIISSDEHFHRVAEHMATVADALDYAHSHGVIHRDIKPHNLILNSDGKMLISDFGLARLAEQPGVTVTGELIGSPLYMSPEQVSGDLGSVNHRTDICSLGATMYEWLTLKPPYPGETREQVISKILTSEPLPLRVHNPRIPVDLETICLKAVERDPNRRYQTAGEMRDDLERYTASQPIQARRASLPTRLGKVIARHQFVSLSVFALLIAVVLGWALITSRQEVKTQTAAAEQEAEQTDKILGYLDALPLEIGGPLRLAEKAVPILTSEGADPSAVGTPTGIAGRATLDFYEDMVAEARSTPAPGGEENAANPVLDHAVELSRTDPDTALGIVDAVLAGQPGTIEAIQLHAALCGRLGQFERMLEDAETLIRLEDVDNHALEWRGLSFMLLGRLENGLVDLDRAVEIGGRSAWHLALRGLLLIKAERLLDALRDFDDALALEPDAITALLGRACGRAGVGNISGALDDLTHVLELDPQNADVLALRGDRYVELTDFEAAEHDYEQAMDISGRTPTMIMRYFSAVTQRRNLSRDGVPDADTPREPDTTDTDTGAGDEVDESQSGANADNRRHQSPPDLAQNGPSSVLS